MEGKSIKHGGAREGSGRKAKLENPAVMSFKVEANLKEKAKLILGKRLPGLYETWLTKEIEKQSK